MAPPSSLVVPLESPRRLSFHRSYPSLKHPHRSLRRLLATVRDRMTRYFCNNKFTHRTSTLLKCIKALVVISMVALGLEGMAIALNGREVVDVANEVWVAVRGSYLAPAVVTATKLCIVLFAFQSMDRIALCLGWVWVKWRRPRPEAKGEFFPMVLVQIPMCNEKEVYAKSISSACELDWPSERLLIQVLDDSDDAITRELIREEVESWMERGVNIVYHHRAVRVGYKAGNLAAGMECEYVRQYEFVAIFDADFRPAPDFLKQTVPHFKDNPELALVQARWEFVNRDENLLTRLQNINLRFHFEVEQQVNGALLGFFGFNGTAGVWRVRALRDAGGWLDRTTVEDMDIAVRAHLKGWRFVFLNHVKVMCELPESFQAYKKQQHRWHSGPMQLLRLCLPSILISKISMWKKMNLIFLFFLLRKLILPLYSFILFCVILPLTMFVPEAELPIWVICYIPILMSILNVLPSPSSFPFIIPYLLFENTMSVTKFHAMLSGLLRLRNAYEWVVTKKSGRSSADEDGEELVARKLKRIQRLDSESDVEVYLDREGTNRRQYHLYRKELALAFLLLTACARSLISKQGIHFYYLLFQGLSFLLVGLDLVGEPSG